MTGKTVSTLADIRHLSLILSNYVVGSEPDISDSLKAVGFSIQLVLLIDFNKICLPQIDFPTFLCLNHGYFFLS